MAIDPQKTAEAIDRMLDAAEAQAAKDLLEAIMAVERRILRLASKLEVDEQDNLLGPKWNLKQAEQMHSRLLQEFELLYIPAVDKVVDGIDNVMRAAREIIPGIHEAFATADAELLQRMKQQVRADLVALGANAQEQIAQQVYNAVAGGQSFSEFEDEVRNALTGIADKRGRPMAQYAETIAHDGIMSGYSTGHKLAADEAGIERFTYYGDVIKDSRPFCAARAGKTFTREEIESWQGLIWAGKRPGSIWIVRGGYRCRHHFMAVVEE